VSLLLKDRKQNSAARRTIPAMKNDTVNAVCAKMPSDFAYEAWQIVAALIST